MWINLQLSCATDIVTDVMSIYFTTPIDCKDFTDCDSVVLSHPVIALWNVRISLKKKLALMGIFSLTVITIVFAVVRIAVMPNKDSSADITWLCLWAHVETGVGKLRKPHTFVFLPATSLIPADADPISPS